MFLFRFYNCDIQQAISYKSDSDNSHNILYYGQGGVLFY